MRPWSVGTVLMAVGIGLVVIGSLVSLGGFGWFGRLPGDIRIERETARIYIPFVSLFVVSLVLSLLLYVARRFF